MSDSSGPNPEIFAMIAKNKHFNGLTPAEDERLAWLCEECSEVIQIGMKIMRHGYKSYNPNDPNQVTNRKLLEQELIDLFKAASLMFTKNDIDTFPQIFSDFQSKFRYMHHNGRNE